MRINNITPKDQDTFIHNSRIQCNFAKSLPRRALLGPIPHHKEANISSTLARAGQSTTRKSYQLTPALINPAVMQPQNQSPQPQSPPSLIDQVKICLSPNTSNQVHRRVHVSKDNQFVSSQYLQRDSLAQDYLQCELATSAANDILSLNESNYEARSDRHLETSAKSLRRQPKIIASKRHYKQPQSMNKLFPADFFASKKKESRGNCIESSQIAPRSLPFNLPDSNTSLLIADQRLSSAKEVGSYPLTHYKRQQPPTSGNCVSGDVIIGDHFPMPMSDIDMSYNCLRDEGNASLRFDNGSPDIMQSDVDQSYTSNIKGSSASSVRLNQLRLQKNTKIPQLPIVAPPAAYFNQLKPLNAQKAAGSLIIKNQNKIAPIQQNNMQVDNISNSQYNEEVDCSNLSTSINGRQVIGLPLSEIHYKQKAALSVEQSPIRVQKPPIVLNRNRLVFNNKRNSTNDSKKSNPERLEQQSIVKIPKVPSGTLNSHKRFYQSNKKEMKLDERLNISNSCCLQPQQLNFQNMVDEKNSFASMAFDECSTQGNNQVETNSSAGTESALFDFPTFYGNQDYFQTKKDSLTFEKSDNMTIQGKFKLPDIMIPKKRSTLAEKTASRSKRSRCIPEAQQELQQDKFSTTFSEMNSHNSTGNDDSSSFVKLASQKHGNGSSLDINVSLIKDEINANEMQCDELELRAARESLQTPCFNKQPSSTMQISKQFDETPMSLFIQESCTESQETQETNQRSGKQFFTSPVSKEAIAKSSQQMTQQQMQGIVNRMQQESNFNLQKVIKFVAEGQPLLRPARLSTQKVQKQVLYSRN